MKNILCIGGSGQLGAKVVSHLSSYHVVNVDFKPHDQAKNNILLEKGKSVADNNKLAIDAINKNGFKYNAILVTAGGWAGGSIKDDDYLQKVKLMN